MAIDLFCYSSMPCEEVRKIADSVAKRHEDLFATRFLISRVREAGPLQKEIALDYGLCAQSYFLIHYNDKSAVGLSSNVVEAIKTAFGVGEILILFENESLR